MDNTLLIPSYNPPGSEDAQQPAIEFNVTVSQTISKDTKVSTDNYSIFVEENDLDVIYDTKTTDWQRAYKENHYTVPQLLKIFANHLRNDINRLGNNIDVKYYQSLIDECEGWLEDDFEVIKE